MTIHGNSGSRRTVSPFAVILVSVTLSVLGLLMIPGLAVSSSAGSADREITVVFLWQGAGAVAIESEMTSVIEGTLNSVAGVEEINSTSENDIGMVTATFKKGTDMEAARFETGTRLRQLRPMLPPDSYYEIQDMASGKGRQLLMSYAVWSQEERNRTVGLVEKYLAKPLGKLGCVDMVSVGGSPQRELQIEYDPDALRTAGLSPVNIADAFSSLTGSRVAGTVQEGEYMMHVRLLGGIDETNLGNLPLRSADGRVMHLSDFAGIRAREAKELSYIRINGRECVNLYVYGADGCNMIRSCKPVRKRMEQLMEQIPGSITVEPAYDASIGLKRNIRSIVSRAVSSLLILLLSVFLISRSVKYLCITAVSIMVNMLVSLFFYRIAGVEIGQFSLIGITVSLGIVIDTVIVMIDHYSRCRDRKVMLPIAAALLTTVAALTVILFLPENYQSGMRSFVHVVSVNLAVSLAVAMLLVPALVDSTGYFRGPESVRFGTRRLIVRMGMSYSVMVEICRRRRWIIAVSSVVLFAVSLFGFVRHNYARSLNQSDDRSPGTMEVAALMPEGTPTEQMNRTSMILEEWLSGCGIVERFETRVSGRTARFSILLREEWRDKRQASEFRDELWNRVLSIGSASWTVLPYNRDDEPYSNLLERSEWKNYMRLYGYDYAQLQKYARSALESILSHSRISDAAILSSEWQNNAESEYHIEYDLERAAMTGSDYMGHYMFLAGQTVDRNIGRIGGGEGSTQVWLRSKGRNYYDLWHIENDVIGSPGSEISLRSMGRLGKRKTGGVIERQNQEYVLRIGYDFVGNDLQRLMLLSDIEESISRSMPFGFRIEAFGGGVDGKAGKSSLLILTAVCIVIYMICAGVFESLLMPLCVIMLIPVGFIGIFCLFPLCGLYMGKGCIAAMVMMSGLVVNASIYIACEMNSIKASRFRSVQGLYIKAFHRKIVPTLLTILSTVLGLLPFIWDGKGEPFWLTFAVGVMAGLLFSIPGLLLLFPLFIPRGYMK